MSDSSSPRLPERDRPWVLRTYAAPLESQQHETTLQRLQRRAAGKGGFGSSRPRPASGPTTIVHSNVSPIQITDSENNNSTASNGTSSNGAAVTTSDTKYFSNWAVSYIHGSKCAE